MYTMEDIKCMKDEDRHNTVLAFADKYQSIMKDFRHGFISEQTRDKEICKLISRTGLHIDLNNL